MINPETFREVNAEIVDIYLNIAITFFMLTWGTVLIVIVLIKEDPMLSRKLARISLVAFIASGLFFLNAGATYLGVNFFEFLTLAVAMIIFVPVYVAGEKIINKIYGAKVS